jgi:hypothetical protein
MFSFFSKGFFIFGKGAATGFVGVATPPGVAPRHGHKRGGNVEASHGQASDLSSFKAAEPSAPENV